MCFWYVSSLSAADISQQDAQGIVRAAKGNADVPVRIQTAQYTIHAFLRVGTGMVIGLVWLLLVSQ